MPYWRLFYHLVWTTKAREPWLTPDVEPVIYELIRTKAVGLGATVFAVNGTVDHIHLVTAIPPRLSVATFIGQVKGVSTARYNNAASGRLPRIYWQEEYGAFTTDGKRLRYLIEYVEHQKEHHRRGTVIPILERIEDVPYPVQLREEASGYLVGEAAWREEMLALNDYD